MQLPSPPWESGWNLPQNSPSCTGQGWGGRGPERGPETRAGPAPASLIFCGQVRPSPSLGSLEDEMGATGQQLPVGSGPTCSQGLPGGRGREKAMSHFPRGLLLGSPRWPPGAGPGAAGRERGRGAPSSGGPLQKWPGPASGPDPTPAEGSPPCAPPLAHGAPGSWCAWQLQSGRVPPRLPPGLHVSSGAGDKIHSIRQTGELSE